MVLLNKIAYPYNLYTLLPVHRGLKKTCVAYIFSVFWEGRRCRPPCLAEATVANLTGLRLRFAILWYKKTCEVFLGSRLSNLTGLRLRLV